MELDEVTESMSIYRAESLGQSLRTFQQLKGKTRLDDKWDRKIRYCGILKKKKMFQARLSGQKYWFLLKYQVRWR